jgi:GAF domain-containing protein
MITDFAPAVRAIDRLVDVARLGLDREAGHRYLQDIVNTVACRLDAPVALIDVLLNEAQVMLASVGPMPEWLGEAGGMPVEWAFCQRLVAERAPSAVGDLTTDPAFRDNPLVTVGGVRAYAGAPLVSHHGQVLGGVCVLDVKPRSFDPAEVAFLEEMAVEAVDRLEAHACE